ncbi:hypothetical protein J2X31_003611 [Flavobacterium arsenatis]|uniref:Uncharacterized protein n=1 Tax=Flavobacterium arsenatis TaxID=1484332 RepID=A0ABU1TUL5_9FLAO|nr:hypothetical protein [Flavobacterium arsenatis]MDR6969578.1 hypothetical protein [Flavobacterium arsenatis]
MKKLLTVFAFVFHVSINAQTGLLPWVDELIKTLCCNFTRWKDKEEFTV